MRMHMPALVRTMATISVVWVAVAQPAHGQLGLPIPGLGGGIVFDPTNFARNVVHYERRLEQIKMQQQQLEAQLNAMMKLRNPNWRDIQLVLARIETIMRAGEALACPMPISALRQRRNGAIDAPVQPHCYPARQCRKTVPHPPAPSSANGCGTN